MEQILAQAHLQELPQMVLLVQQAPQVPRVQQAPQAEAEAAERY
jgi:hypothetical protein